MCQITRIQEFLESYRTLNPYLKELVSSCKDHYVRQLFIEYEKKGIKNYQNLAVKTSITDLISQISNLDLFITGDSGPMHIAASFQIPTVAIFGPTNDHETSQWGLEKSIIVKKNLDCQPCMKRTCPLKHHNCMKLIKSDDVLRAIQSFN